MNGKVRPEVNMWISVSDRQKEKVEIYFKDIVCLFVGDERRQRETERDRERHRETEAETERETERETSRETGRERQAERDRIREKE